MSSSIASTSAVSSSTESNAAPSSSSTDSNNNSNPSFFSPGSSPPLILAFLAIGLFAAAMIAVFGWRRIQFGTAVGSRADVDERLRHLGKRPKLWDLWTGKRASTSDAWETIMPISAIVHYPISDTKRDHSKSSVAFLPLHQFLRSRRDGDSSSLNDDDDDDDNDVSGPVDVQVAVAVAMPSPPIKRLSIAPSSSPGKEPEKITDERALVEYFPGTL
ncbi:uncharacterized protein EV420DRAFT_1646723 [Desarmillaria tabescens]|uniref:Uncharacterized protein n=1 Tax=Armillaria tabescens TaxID=1929756 RepID=A0AA39JXN6_ARMTA|nr:uncharacterized protein EV420DRAFT_1646723 [Desarmillaria tabescens]KAK0449730.1 hypothetical protein EV420DRAFT_1646723 [Desarmillaria tabescens]